jgi:hypothetical protein
MIPGRCRCDTLDDSRRPEKTLEYKNRYRYNVEYKEKNYGHHQLFGIPQYPG